jgi:hypothetical protein
MRAAAARRSAGLPRMSARPKASRWRSLNASRRALAGRSPARSAASASQCRTPGAIKRAVDDDPRPGRFLLTGSLRAELEADMWSGTGRLVRLRLYGLSEREVVGRPNGMGFIDRLAGAKAELSGLPADVPDLRGYIELAVRSGYPEPALRLSGVARQAWLDGYLDQLLTRDAENVTGLRDPAHLRFLRNQLGERSLGGAVLHTGPRAVRLSDGIFAIPICGLWA